MITTASQICLGVTGSTARSRHSGPSPVGIVSGMSGRTTPTIARNLQAVTTSPVWRRSENWRMRPFECSTRRIETASRTRYHCGNCSATGPTVYVNRAMRTPIIPGLLRFRILSP